MIEIKQPPIADRQAVVRLTHRILELVATCDEVTMSRLAREFPEFREGNSWIHIAENVVIWTHATHEAGLALLDLVGRDVVLLQPCCLACHLRTGGYFMKLPIAQTMTNHQSPHWWPVRLQPGARLAPSSGTMH